MNRAGSILGLIALFTVGCSTSDGSLPDEPDAAPSPDAPDHPDAADTSDAAPPDAKLPAPVINEFVANHVGSPDDQEFIEILGEPDTDYSAFTLLLLEGDYSAGMPTIRGGIDVVLPVGTTDGDGFWDTGLRTDYFENGTMTILLVDGFASSPGVDLDTDDDGTLDLTPWDVIIDDIAVDDGQTDNRTYATAILAADFDGAALTVGGASRLPDGTDTDAPGDWVRNDFDLDNADPGEARNTRGATNSVVP